MLLYVPQIRNLGVLFDSNLSLSGHISSITESCFSQIRDLRRIRPIHDQTTARNTATAHIHSKLDYSHIHSKLDLTLYFSIFLQIKWIVFSLFVILLLMQLLKPPNFVT
jgi:hypothetical protein